MIVLSMPQMSPEWFAAKAGRPSASSAAKILTSTGKKSAQWKSYQHELLAQRLGIGKPPFEPTEAMLEGIAREDESRAAYAFLKGVEVEQVGMAIHPELCASCSPDGLIGREYGLELKNPQGHTFVGELLAGKVPGKYLPQVHMSMVVTGLDAWDYCAYVPGMDLIIHRVERGSFTESFDAALQDFCGELEVLATKLSCPPLSETNEWMEAA